MTNDIARGGPEDIEYRGFPLQVKPQGPGWAVFIHPPGGGFTLQEIPYSEVKDERGDVIAKAMALVDAALEMAKTQQKTPSRPMLAQLSKDRPEPRRDGEWS
jgi:hypothetical protein